MDWITWYNALSKPSWTPSPQTISLIWMILYPIIAVSFSFVFFMAIRRRLRWGVVLPFVVNLIANLLFMPLFAGWRSVPLATVDILLVLGTIVWAMVAVWPHYRLVSIAQVPYLVWVAIAAVLQVSIAAMNW